MPSKFKSSFLVPEREATPEEVYFNRRRFLGAAGAAAGSLIAAAGCQAKDKAKNNDRAGSNPSPFLSTLSPTPSSDLYPAKRNPAYKLDRPLTREQDAAGRPGGLCRIRLGAAAFGRSGLRPSLQPGTQGCGLAASADAAEAW